MSRTDSTVEECPMRERCWMEHWAGLLRTECGREGERRQKPQLLISTYLQWNNAKCIYTVMTVIISIHSIKHRVVHTHRAHVALD